ncbi:nicotinate-nucleotide--dimethylbenzimidazole phosphoribosyltransferase [Sphingobium sp. SA2]|nr:nicotinate-nucleotide--dimethylbenzimidazole phosphoribosyltransferase [Sphingobium sp. SA2]MDT7535461.1 nicotinate-nucleotide--dimethylbenzimidazole phosphoribosyltransferase [Sphingobium sp. SA2]
MARSFRCATRCPRDGGPQTGSGDDCGAVRHGLALGAAEAQVAIDAGHRLLIAGETGIGNTAAAACLTHLLAGIDADTATASGAGADAAMRGIKRDIVTAAVDRLGGRNDKAKLDCNRRVRDCLCNDKFDIRLTTNEMPGNSGFEAEAIATF